MKTHFIATTFVALGLAFAAPAQDEHAHAHGEHDHSNCSGHDHGHDHAAHEHKHGEHDHSNCSGHDHGHDHAAHEHKHAEHDHSNCSGHDHGHDHAAHEHKHGEHDHSNCSGHDHGHDHAAHEHKHGEHDHSNCSGHDHGHDHAAHEHKHGEHDHSNCSGHDHGHNHAAHEHKHGEHDHSNCSGHDHGHDHAAHEHKHGEHDHSNCSGHDHGHDHANGPGTASAVVKADARSRYMLRMKLEEVPPTGMYLTHSLYGYLTVPSHAMETYALPCSGKITMSVKTAQSVKKGDELYSLVSPEIIEHTAGVQQVESSLARCKEEVQTIKARLARLQKIGTVNSDLESQLQFKQAEQRHLQRDLDVARARLDMLVMGAETELRNGVTTLVVRAHTDGKVRNVGVNQGSWGEQGAAVVTMSNTAAMEIEATLYASDQPEVTEIRATMLSGREHEAVSGKWRFDEQIDTERQTRSLYFTPDTLPQDARAGQLCRLDLYQSGANSKTVNIPDSAVVRVGLDDVVFVEVSEGTYAMVKVHASASRRGMTPVEGLLPGQRIVVKGGNELRYLLPSDGKQKKAGHFHADGKFHEGDHHE